MHRVISMTWKKKEEPEHYVESWIKHCIGCLHYGSGEYNYSVNRESNMISDRKSDNGTGCKCGVGSAVEKALTKEKENDKVPECTICSSCGAHHPVAAYGAAKVVCSSCDSKERLRPKYKKEGVRCIG